MNIVIVIIVIVIIAITTITNIISLFINISNDIDINRTVELQFVAMTCQPRLIHVYVDVVDVNCRDQ